MITVLKMKMFMYTGNCAVNEFVILFQDVRTLSKIKYIKLFFSEVVKIAVSSKEFGTCKKNPFIKSHGIIFDRHNRGLSFHFFGFVENSSSYKFVRL